MNKYFLSIWNALDPIYLRCTRLTYLEEMLDSKNIFRVRLTTYKGRDVTLSDGTYIKKNDTLLKIHLHNIRILNELCEVNNEMKKGRIIYRLVEQSLPGIEQYLSVYMPEDKVKGIIGITSLNKGCERLGFETVPISHPLYKWFKWFCFLPISILSNPNQIWNTLLRPNTPSYLFMSKNKLRHLYHPDPV